MSNEQGYELATNRLKQLLDFCEPCGIYEDGGFGYAPDYTGWKLVESLRQFIVLYSDGKVSVETWHEMGDEADRVTTLMNPSIVEIVDEWVRQANELNEIYERLRDED